MGLCANVTRNCRTAGPAASDAPHVTGGAPDLTGRSFVPTGRASNPTGSSSGKSGSDWGSRGNAPARTGNAPGRSGNGLGTTANASPTTGNASGTRGNAAGARGNAFLLTGKPWGTRKTVSGVPPVAGAVMPKAVRGDGEAAGSVRAARGGAPRAAGIDFVRQPTTHNRKERYGLGLIR